MNASTTADVVARILHARGERTSLRIVGAGRWLDSGGPCTARTGLDLSALSGIIEYEPGDLTITARAATSLADLAHATAAEGQWLPLDPAGPLEGTLGATMATASAGPLAAAYGTVRDQALGCEIVTGRGDIVRAGGRVVKNVAGYDLTRLMTGAWGSLGAITEVTMRLRARPESDETVALALDDPARLGTALRWLRTSPFTPFAAEVLSPSLAIALVGSSRATLLLRCGGRSREVSATFDEAASVAPCVGTSTAVWQRLAGIEPPGSAVLRLSCAPARFDSLWNGAVTVIEQHGGFVHGTPRRGVVRCILPMMSAGDADIRRLRDALEALPRATRIAERLPAVMWERAPTDRVRDALTLGIRDVFDPDRVLNPGITGMIE